MQRNQQRSAIGVDRDEIGLDQDLLWGTQAIAAALGLTEDAAYRQLTLNRLPAKKILGRWVASRSGLRSFFADIVAGKVA
jgi:hypothetical protein